MGWVCVLYVSDCKRTASPRLAHKQAAVTTGCTRRRGCLWRQQCRWGEGAGCADGVGLCAKGTLTPAARQVPGPLTY
jgi:hypothetical protein